MEKIYKNSHYFFISVLLMAFAGFWKTYFSKIPTFEGVTTPMQFHGLMCLLWLGILIAQPILIRQKKLDWHRTLGKTSYIVVPLLILSMAILIRLAFIRNDPNNNLIGFADILFFLFSYGMAVYYRKNTAYHARYMVLSVLPFINPSLGRLDLPGPILALIIMIGLLIYERFNNKVYRPYALSLPIYFVVYVLFIFVIKVAAWKNFWWMFF